MAGPENGCIQEPTESTTDDELEEAVAVNDYMSPRHSYDQASAATDAGVSKWQLKGKRNSRNVVKRPIIKSLKRSSVPMDGTYLEGKGYNSNSMALAEQSRYQASECLDYDYDVDEVIEKKSLHNQMLDFGSRRYPSMPKGVSKNSHRTNVGNVGSGEDSVWEADGLSQAAFRGYWDESVECYDPLYSGSRLGSGKESMLVDVDLKVQASYQGEHVPLVSLMSRLNGKAIIGHPVQIEVLEDGFSDVFLSTNEDLSEELFDNDGSTALRPVWRTARRTNMHRVPRPHPSTSLNADEAGDQLQFLVPESKPPYNKLNTVTPSQIARKSSDVCASAGKKISKKPTRKASLTSQKTRTLSSFAMEQKLNGKGGSNKINRSGLDGLIKPENGPTTVTCIPLKLVFSRLLEAVGRPPSRPMNHIMSIDGDKEKKQLPGSM